MARYLRIAAAVVFALLGLAFVGLWVRSYYWLDEITGDGFRLVSYYGLTAVSFFERGNVTLVVPFWDTTPAIKAETIRFWKTGFLGFKYDPGNSIPSYLIPHWFLAASSLGLAALLAIKRTWRFSLRTVLVATTILAAVLGLAVYAV